MVVGVLCNSGERVQLSVQAHGDLHICRRSRRFVERRFVERRRRARNVLGAKPRAAHLGALLRREPRLSRRQRLAQALILIPNLKYFESRNFDQKP